MKPLTECHALGCHARATRWWLDRLSVSLLGYCAEHGPPDGDGPGRYRHLEFTAPSRGDL